MTDDGNSVNDLTPKGAMHALTQVALKAGDLQDDLELVRLALLGALQEAKECDMDAEGLSHQCARLLDKLMSMYTDAAAVTKLVRDAGVAFGALVEDHPDGGAA